MAFRSILLALAAASVAAVVTTAAARTGAPPAPKYVLGISSAVARDPWHEELVCAAKAQAKASGMVREVIVAGRAAGPAEQSADIRDLVSEGASAIVIDPSSPTALDPAIREAAARGVRIVSVEQRVTAPQAYNVTTDQVAYGRLGAEWLFRKLGGRGNVVEMRGVPGIPLDTDRHAGFQQALKKYPGIEVVKQTFTGWRFATGGKQILDVLDSGLRVDGVWTSGIDYTVVNALRTAGRTSVPVVGADTNQFLLQLRTLYPRLQGAAVTNPAAIGGVGASVAIRLLSGRPVPKWIKLAPQVWDYRSDAETIARSSSWKRPPAYSSQLFVEPWTTYTEQQLVRC